MNLRNRKSRIISLLMILTMIFTQSAYSFAQTTEGEGTESSAATAAHETAAPTQAETQETTAVPEEQATSSDGESAEDQESETTETSEATEPTEEKESYPAQTLRKTAGDGATVTVTAPEGAFPAGSELSVKTVAASSVQGAIEKKVDVADLAAYDINVLDKNGKEIQPKKSVKVNISNASVSNADSIYHVNDSKTSAEAVSGSASGSHASFSASHFSIYVVVNGEPAITTYNFIVDGTTVSSQDVKNGGELVEPQHPYKSGYKFLGWYNGSTRFDSFGTQTVTENATVNLTAQFAEVHYVYFMDTNGSVACTKEGVKDDVITVSDVTLDTVSHDQALTGWYTDKALTNRVDSVTMGTENIRLYPKVEAAHWLSFDSNGGSYIGSVIYRANQNTEKPANPTRAGYTFKGWKDAQGNAYTFGSTLTEDTTLYASWQANTNTRYTVIYWQENADDENYSYKESVTATGVTGEKATYTAKTYNGFTLNTTKTETSKTIAGDGSTIVNVYYDRNEYTVYWKELKWSNFQYSWETFHQVTAKWGASIGDQWPGGNWAVSTAIDSKYQAYLEVMPLGGMTFYGQKSGQGTSTATYYVESLADSTKYITHHQDKIKGTTWTVTSEDKYELKGFTYKSGTSNGSKYDGAKFYYSRNSYKIVFINNGNTDNTKSFKYQADISGAGYTPTAPAEYKGFTFAGWYDNELCAGDAYVFTGKTMPAQNITLYAKWEAPTYTVTAHASSDDTGTAIKVSYGGTIDQSKLPAVTPPKGRAQTGWAYKDKDGNLIPFNLNDKIYQDWTIYPYFVSDGTAFTVTYVDKNGTVSYKDADTYEAGSKAALVSLETTGFSSTDGEFLGWAAANGTLYQPGDKITIEADTVLTAKWGKAPATASVTYDPNGGTGTAVTVTGLKNNAVVENKTASGLGFSRADYEFIGWNTDPNATSSIFDKGTVRVDDLNGSNTLYAIWVKKVIITVSGSTKTDVFNGEKQTNQRGIIVSGAPANVTVALKNPTEFEVGGTDCGTYSKTFTTEDLIVSGAEGLSVTIAIDASNNKIVEKITPRPLTITVDNATKVYGEGDPAFTGSITEGKLDNDDFLWVITYSRTNDAEDVGTYTGVLTASYSENSNYEVTVKNGDFTITKADTMTVTAKDQSQVYNGKSLGTSDVTPSVTKGTTIYYKVGNGEWKTTPPSITNVDESCTVDVKAVNKNYKDATTSYKLTVTKADLIIHDEQSVPYNSEEQTLELGQNSAGYGQIDGESVSVSGYTIAGREAGEYTDVAKSETASCKVAKADNTDSTGNYNIKISGKLIITKVNPGDMISIDTSDCSYKGVYDGEDHGQAAILKASSDAAKTDTTVWYSTDNGKTWSEDYPTVRDYTKGAITVQVKATNANFTKDYEGDDYTLEVTRRLLTVRGADTEYQYDGSTKVVNITAGDLIDTSKAGEGLVKGEILSISGATISGVEPGTYTDVSDYTWKVTRPVDMGPMGGTALIDENDPADSTANYTIDVSGQLVISEVPGDDPGDDDSDKSDSEDTSTRTGDSTPIGLLLGLMAAATAGGGLTVFGRKRKEQE